MAFMLCCLSALLLVLSFPPFDLGFLAWVGFVPLFFALENSSFKKTFWLSGLSGFLFFIGLLHWLHHVTWAGMTVLVIYLSFYVVLFGTGTKCFKGRRHLFIPSLWVTLEFLRSTLFTGFGWGLLGYSQWKFIPLIQFADLTGAYGISFLVMFANLVFFHLLQTKQIRKKQFLFFLLLVACCLSLGYGKVRTSFLSSPETFRASVIQGNIPQDLKWDRSVQDLILKKYETLTRAVSENRSDAIFWPETAVPGLLPDETPLGDRLVTLSKESGSFLIVGTPWVEAGRITNSALLLEGGEVGERYDKVHLVPFGEFIPFERHFPFLREWIVTGDFHPGKVATIFKHPKGNFATLICFEDIFPGLVRRFVKESEFLVNMTNDAWFGRSGAPIQHAQASVFRAIENRRSVLRVTNTGYTCLIDPAGRVVQELEVEGERLFVTGFRTWEIPLSRQSTFYTRHGDLFAWGCVIVTLLSLVFSRRETRSKEARNRA